MLSSVSTSSNPRSRRPTKQPPPKSSMKRHRSPSPLRHAKTVACSVPVTNILDLAASHFAPRSAVTPSYTELQTELSAVKKRLNDIEAVINPLKALLPLLRPDFPLPSEPSTLHDAAKLIDALATEVVCRQKCKLQVIAYNVPDKIPADKAKFAILQACGITGIECKALRLRKYNPATCCPLLLQFKDESHTDPLVRRWSQLSLDSWLKNVRVLHSQSQLQRGLVKHAREIYLPISSVSHPGTSANLPASSHKPTSARSPFSTKPLVASNTSLIVSQQQTLADTHAVVNHNSCRRLPKKVTTTAIQTPCVTHNTQTSLDQFPVSDLKASSLSQINIPSVSTTSPGVTKDTNNSAPLSHCSLAKTLSQPSPAPSSVRPPSTDGNTELANIDLDADVAMGPTDLVSIILKPRSALSPKRSRESLCRIPGQCKPRNRNVTQLPCTGPKRPTYFGGQKNPTLPQSLWSRNGILGLPPPVLNNTLPLSQPKHRPFSGRRHSFRHRPHPGRPPPASVTPTHLSPNPQYMLPTTSTALSLIMYLLPLL